MLSADLENTDFEKKIVLEIEGWEKLEIEYMTKAYSGISWLFWKVSGTEHVFQIQYQIVLSKHAGSMKDHFELVLETFRNDYLLWNATRFQEEWMKNYEKMFKRYIKLQK